MKTIVLGPQPPEITAFLARRRALGQDLFDEVWEGVVEVLSPHDETWEKFGFYARHGVEEVCVVDPRAGEIRWFVLADGAYEETGASPLLGVTAEGLAGQIDWPR